MKFKVVLRIKKDYKSKREFYVLKRNYTIFSQGRLQTKSEFFASFGDD